MDKGVFLDFLNMLLIHAHQLCLIENAKQSAEFIQQTNALLRYYKKQQNAVLLSEEIDILKKYAQLFVMIENRVQNIKIEVDDNIDQRNIFVKRLMLIDRTQAFFQASCSNDKQIAMIGIKIMRDMNKIRLDLSSSIGSSDSFQIDTDLDVCL